MKLRAYVACALATAVLASAATGASAGKTSRRFGDLESQTGLTLREHDGLADYDHRGPALAPLAAARSELRRIAAGHELSVSWSRFGTPASVSRIDGGWLATGLRGSAATAARQWVRTHRALFGLTAADVDGLELVNAAEFADSPARAVLFRQRYAGLRAGIDGLITVGIRDGNIAIVTSSSSGSMPLRGTVRITPSQAWLAAAKDAGHNIKPTDLVATGIEHTGFMTFRAPGLSGVQRARPVAVPTRAGAVAAFETVVMNVHGGHAEAYTHFVNAVTGEVLVRQSRVQQAEDNAGDTAFVPSGGQYSGSTGRGKCGPRHPFTVGSGVSAVAAVAVSTPPGSDIVVSILRGSTVVASADAPAGPEPEAAVYAPGEGVSPGKYSVQICPYAVEDGFDYSGVYATYDGPLPKPGSHPAKWSVFPANPPMSGSSKDIRSMWCWERKGSPSTTKPLADCDDGLANLAARAPWDINPTTGQPTYTTRGNFAQSASAWLGPAALAPAENYSPISPLRDYIFPWTNVWHDSKTPGEAGKGCAPSSFNAPDRNDIDSSTANLFAMHNRMHDWSYFLGFTERNYNMQVSNENNTGAQYENDPEVGNSQAGGLNGGYPAFLGRDNANQITLNDGVPGITNMYLWQPIPGAFYADCSDGDYDMSVIGHEYTHAISNRMVGGPDAGLAGAQAGAMGESWSDLAAVEYLNEFGFAGKQGELPFAVGAYVTGDKIAGIRNYNMALSPLTYANVGYDMGGAQVHADGEIWSATMYRVRQALVSKYNKAYPYKSAGLQRRCARGEVPAERCPGNRRWIQNVFDAWLLMQPAVSFVDARDAMLAADRLRTGGANQRTMWQAFAQKGLGPKAVSEDANDPDPIADFVSPATKPATVTFRLVDAASGKAVRAAQVFIGRYEARTTPIADTDSETSDIGAKTRLAAGPYELLVVAPGYGHHRFKTAFPTGKTLTQTYRLTRNLASLANGAAAAGDGTRHGELIDDTEASNWTFVGAPDQLPDGSPDPRTPGKPIKNRSVTVNLAGGVQTIQHFSVSTINRPPVGDTETDDPPQGRFAALRRFALDVSTNGKTFKTVYVSAENAFPARRPRPRAPELHLRTFKLAKPVKASHVRIRVLTNQCTGAKVFNSEQDADPTFTTDCTAGSLDAFNVRIAELQVFGPGAGVKTGVRNTFSAQAVEAPATGTAADFSADLAAAPAPDLRSAGDRSPLTRPAAAALAVLLLAGTAFGLRRRRAA